MPPDDTAAPAPVRVLIPAAIQRRTAERVAELRDEIAAFAASLPPAQEPRP